MENPIDKAKRKAARSLKRFVEENRVPTYFRQSGRQNEYEEDLAVTFLNDLLSLIRIHKEELGR